MFLPQDQRIHGLKRSAYNHVPKSSVFLHLGTNLVETPTAQPSNTLVACISNNRIKLNGN